MIDKEQIIIDGVDVSECVSFDKLNGQNICCYEDTREDKILFANFCVENKDCYFKQLARKTQECEELKAYAQRQENQREEYYKEFLKKDKALDEIKSICLKDIHTFADGTELRYDSLDDILDIINKAKGEE